MWAIAYLFVFGLGTIAGMMLMTATIAMPITYSARFSFFHRPRPLYGLNRRAAR